MGCLRDYVSIATGVPQLAADLLRRPSRQRRALWPGPSLLGSKRRLANTPELKEQRNATVLYVFGL